MENKTNDIKTTPEYWDCECEKNYIKPKKQRMCFDCNSVKSEQPDSRESEVDRHLMNKGG